MKFPKGAYTDQVNYYVHFDNDMFVPIFAAYNINCDVEMFTCCFIHPTHYRCLK